MCLVEGSALLSLCLFSWLLSVTPPLDSLNLSPSGKTLESIPTSPTFITVITSIYEYGSLSSLGFCFLLPLQSAVICVNKIKGNFLRYLVHRYNRCSFVTPQLHLPLQTSQTTKVLLLFWPSASHSVLFVFNTIA